MKVGAEPKKLALLVVLLLVAGFLYLRNFSSAPAVSVPVAEPSREAKAKLVTVGKQEQSAVKMDSPATGLTSTRRSSTLQAMEEFRPSLIRAAKFVQEQSNIDPTLRTDLLVQVKNVELKAGSRNLFQFAPAPVLDKLPPKVVPEPVKPEPPKPPPTPSTQLNKQAESPLQPIPLKFYGYARSTTSGQRRGFFLLGDEILVVGEGELIKDRYKLLRLGITAVEIEDVQSGHRQTIRIVEETG